MTVEFVEPDDLPRQADRETLNRYLEAFYNDGAENNTYVPRSIWEKGGVRQLPEPNMSVRAGDVAAVPEATRTIVMDHLREAAGVSAVNPEDHLARDLGLDSLARTELIAWLEQEFGFPQGNAESLETVADVMLAACGEAVAAEPAALAPVPAKWSERGSEEGRVEVAPGGTVAEAFLATARLSPDSVAVADQRSGARTYRDLIASVYVLRGELGFEGFVVSDWASVAELVEHGVCEDRRGAAEQAFNAGVDMDMCSGAYAERSFASGYSRIPTRTKRPPRASSAGPRVWRWLGGPRHAASFC